MHSLKQLKSDNLHAAIREATSLLREINEKEAILGLPLTPNNPPYGIANLRQRLSQLRQQAAANINPASDETQRQPILWGDYQRQNLIQK